VDFSNLNRRHKVGLFLAVAATGLSLLLEASAKQTAGILVLGIATAWLIGSLSSRTLGIVACLLACASGLVMAAKPVKEDLDRYRLASQQYESAVDQLRDAIAKAPTVTWDVFDPVSEARKRWPGFKDWDDARILKNLNDAQKFRAVFPDYSLLTQRIAVYDPQGRRGTIPLAQIEDVLKQGYKLYDGGKPGPTKTVDIPESAREWERPQPEGSDWVDVTASFPSEKSNEDILREFETRILRPKPSFSIMAAIRAHRMPFSIGAALTVSGLLACLWLSRRPRGSI